MDKCISPGGGRGLYGRITLVFPSYRCAGPRTTSAGLIPCVCQSRHGFIWDPQTGEPRGDEGSRQRIRTNCLLRGQPALPGLVTGEGGERRRRGTVHGILQARILEWVATSFSRGSSQPMLFWVPDVLCRHLEVVLWNLLGV